MRTMDMEASKLAWIRESLQYRCLTLILICVVNDDKVL